MSVVPILLCSLVYVKSVSSNIPKHFSAVSSSDPFIVGLSSINIMYNGPSSGYPLQLGDKHHDECKDCCQKRPRQVKMEALQQTISVCFSLGWICMLASLQKSGATFWGIQNCEENASKQHAFSAKVHSAFVNNFWLWRSFQVTVLCPLLW